MPWDTQFVPTMQILRPDLDVPAPEGNPDPVDEPANPDPFCTPCLFCFKGSFFHFF